MVGPRELPPPLSPDEQVRLPAMDCDTRLMTTFAYTGSSNVVLSPDVYAQCRLALQGAFVLIDGVVQKDHGATNVVAHHVRGL